ncbi:peptidoglycan DD-metalloendopeptidase family protein [Xanthomonadaceae bacterium JHOS43]|nr:peptidoglycan DD-metalloendopeptidase family protein [Xanthomonadaceae bacterium JHOS43]
MVACATFIAAFSSTADDRAAREAETQRKLTAIREEIASLTSVRNNLDAERSDAARALREADQSVDSESRILREIEARIDEQAQALEHLEGERTALEQRLGTQREALAALLRSAYALGRHEQLKLLLAQDRIDALARVLAYHRYFQRERIQRIDTLLAELEELATVVRQVREQREALDASQAEQAARIVELESVRETRRTLVAELDNRFKDTDSRLRALGRDEQALAKLLEKLQDIFADIPERLDAAQPFAQRKGRLGQPLAGRTRVGYGGSLPDGRKSLGWLIEAEPGAPVKAVAHGRVAFSDWLKGYGLIVILDHGEGWMSLYAQNDSLHRDVGDWVNPGDTLASAGSSGGQAHAALYFELRRNGRPVDPRGWFAAR